VIHPPVEEEVEDFGRPPGVTFVDAVEDRPH
jgi:hypothetical protein